MDELPEFYTDPYLRRYFLVRYMAEASLVVLGVWGIRNVIENIQARRWRKLTPWLEISLGFFYFDQKIYEKFILKV